MGREAVIVTLLGAFNLIIFCVASDSNSFLVTTTETGIEKKISEKNTNDVTSPINPEIYSMQINVNVSNRFAKTIVTSKVKNSEQNASETTFSVILPEHAFISHFEMEIGGKVYTAYVKEKEEAKRIYQQAVSSGQSAAHVEMKARDSKSFVVSVNIEPQSKTIFRLTYEELLQRQNGQYELVVNIHPGQIVEDLNVQVNINESRPLTFVKTPSLRTGNEISKNKENLDPSTEIKILNQSSAIVEFKPDIAAQKEFALNLGSKKEKGLAGQFIVQYDVERDPLGGEVLIRDGYFVHFFAPSELKPLPKHVVFVLDHSGSMSGKKIEQLVEAMKNILSELKPEDLFNIIRFSDDIYLWDASLNEFTEISLPSHNYGHLERHLREIKLPQAVAATDENIGKAKNVMGDISNLGLTNIIGGLEVGLFIIKKTQETHPNKYQPLIIFLTDGFPNVGMSSSEEITKTVTNLNSGTNRAIIFSLSFGENANKDFLKKLSSENLGFSRHIYEASDASLQLEDFYRKISSPLLTNVTFKYVDEAEDVTQNRYPIFFNGSELVVAGKMTGHVQKRFFLVDGTCTTGHVTFNASRVEPVTSLERLWAYLTVKQILKEREIASNKSELTKKALDLSLKYSFVTDVSSLVVVKPNKTDAVDPARADTSSDSRNYPVHLMRSGVLHSPTRSFYSPRSGMSFQPQASSVYRSQMMPVWSPRFGGGAPVTFAHKSRRPLLATTTTPVPTTALTPNTTLPQWLDDLSRKNGNITTSQGIFKLGRNESVTIHPECPKSPGNTSGTCVLVFNCPQIFHILSDMNVYLQYFCPLNEYAGVCCPKNNTTPTN